MGSGKAGCGWWCRSAAVSGDGDGAHAVDVGLGGREEVLDVVAGRLVAGAAADDPGLEVVVEEDAADAERFAAGAGARPARSTAAR